MAPIISRPTLRSNDKPAGMLRRVLLNTYVVVIGAYGLNTTAFLLVRAFVGERWNIVGLFNSYLHLLIIPSVILLPISLLLRRRWLVIELAAPFLFFISTYGTQFLPRTTLAEPTAPQLKLLSFNLNKNNDAIDAVTRIIQESDADVVAIQELSTSMASAFEANLAEAYPYLALHPQSDFSGQGVLSRFPLSNDHYWQINLGHQQIQVDWNGQDIEFFNVHPVHPLRGLQFDGESRAEEITDILRRANASTDPVLIIGDFNMTNLSDDYARVTAEYVDAYTQGGWGMGFTFPNFARISRISYLPPLARIDYIFHDQRFQTVNIQVGANAGRSDHFPLIATVALVDTP